MTKTFLVVAMLQFQVSPHTMPKKSGKKEAKTTKVDSDVETISKMEIIYENNKAITRVEKEFKWDEIYHMIRDRNVPKAGLEDMNLYENIRRSGIIKVATRLDIFSCTEVIKWILPRTYPSSMMISNI